MESKGELKKIDIKNHLIRFWDGDIDFSDILLGQKLYKEKYENILIYDISYKTSTGAKPLRIRFDKIDGFIKVRIKINQIQNIFKWMFVYYKCYISVKLMFLKEPMLMKLVHQKRVIFVTIGIS